MLQTFLKSAIALAGQGFRFSQHILQGAQAAILAVLPESMAHRKWVIVGAFSLPVFGAVVAIASSGQPTPLQSRLDSADTVIQAIDLNLAQQDVYVVDPLVAVEKIRRGDSLVSVLSRLGVKADGLKEYIASHPQAKQLGKLKTGHIITIQQTADRDFVWLRYRGESDEESQTAMLLTKQNGQYSLKTEVVQYDKQLVSKAGKIESSLFGAADKAGLPDGIATQLADIFGSEIDFHRELQKGDEFRVVYEDFYLDGRSARVGRIVSAEFVNSGRSYKAYWFAAKGQAGAYYNERGESLKKAFLRSPLAVSRISSGFSPARFHPILNTWRAHKGVDYAAPTGTPIMATASGVVKFSGKQNGYGNFIEIQHQGGYSTAYAHLSGFAKGVAKGRKVEQGQVIGYVGATGWATGPHLHYEFRKNQEAINPLSVKFAQSIPLSRDMLVEFRRTQVALDKRMGLASTQQLALAR